MSGPTSNERAFATLIAIDDLPKTPVVINSARSYRQNDHAPFGNRIVALHPHLATHLADPIARLRAKIKYRPVVFELMPPRFTLLQLQRTVEAIAGVALHKQNFRRVLERAGLVEGLGRFDADTGGRPAELFRFKRELLSAKPVPGLALPLLRD